MYILHLITLFAFIVSLIAAVYYFQKYNKIRNRLSGIDGKQELMKPYNLLMQELEQKQQQLKQQNLQQRLLVKAIKLKLWKWDLKRKEIIWGGDLEKDEQEVTVVNADEHLSHILPEYRKRIYEMIDGLEKDSAKLIDEEFLYQNEDNTLSWRNIYGAVYEYDENGKPAVLIGGTQIIGARKKLENDLRDAKDKAEEANRLKTAFLANMSHEIRTPLNAIVGFSGILADTEDIAEKKELCNLINHNNALLLKIVDDILDISKIEAGYIDLHPTWFCLSDLIMESATEYRVKTAGRLDIRIHNTGQDYMVELDAKRVKQILNNFLSNALKHTQEGYIDITYGIAEQGIKIKVTDTGCGIPQEKLSIVFERFEKVDAFTQGVGLGLPICKSLVDCMGGSIGLTSEEGVGTTVWVTLPCGTAPVPKLHKETSIDNFYS